MTEKLQFTTIAAAQILRRNEIRRDFFKKNRPLKVLFLLPEISLWDVYRSVYDEMVESKYFDPHVIAFGRADIISEISNEDYKKFLDKLCIKYTFVENSLKSPLDSFSPDIVFYTLGTVAYPEAYRIEFISMFCLTCYLSYGFLLVNELDYQFGQSFHHASWKIFASTQREKLEYEARTIRLTPNVEVVGYPKFDLYIDKPSQTSRISAPSAPSSRPCMIWAPHWTIGLIYPALNLGTFHEICNEMLVLMEEFKQVDFIFKPHPNLRYACDKTTFMSKEIYDDYLRNLEKLPNVSVCEDGNNIERFKKSTALITDSVSFLAEYLPTGCPLLFLERDDRAIFSSAGENIISSHYRGRGMKDIRDFINKTLNGDDPKKPERQKVIESELNIQSSTAKNILNHIMNELFLSSPSKINEFKFFLVTLKQRYIKPWQDTLEGSLALKGDMEEAKTGQPSQDCERSLSTSS